MLQDEQVIALIKGGDGGALDFIINKYRHLVQIKAQAYYLTGADSDDIIQEGMIGLYKAVRGFDPDKFPVFYSFAKVCIVRQMLSAIKAAARCKHLPLNKYIPLNSVLSREEGGNEAFEITAAENSSNPEDIFISKECKFYIESEIKKALSPFEINTLSLFLSGKTYSEIAEILNKDEKSVDNSLQRARKKITRILSKK